MHILKRRMYVASVGFLVMLLMGGNVFAYTDNGFTDTFDGTRRYLAIDPSVTDTTLTTAQINFEQGIYRGESFDFQAAIIMPFPDGSVRAYAPTGLQGEVDVYESIDGEDFLQIMNGAQPEKLVITDPLLDYTDATIYRRVINSGFYDDKGTDALSDDEIYVLYRISPTVKDLRLASSPAYDIQGNKAGFDFTYQAIVAPFPLPTDGAYVPEGTNGEIHAAIIGSHGLDSRNGLVRDTTRSGDNLGFNGVRPFARTMMNTAVFYSAIHPDRPDDYQIPADHFCIPSTPNYCYKYYDHVRRGIGTSGVSISLDNVTSSDAWDAVYDMPGGDAWSIVVDPLEDTGSSLMSTADPDAYDQNAMHYFDNIISTNDMYRNKGRNESGWSINQNQNDDTDAIYPTWAFSPGGDARWFYPSVLESNMPLEDISGNSSDSDTQNFVGQAYASDLIFNKEDHVLLAHIAYSPTNHDVPNAVFTTELFEFREDGFMSFLDPVDSGESTWVTNPISLPEKDSDTEHHGLHISADIEEGGWIEVGVARDEAGTLTPVSGFTSVRIEGQESYYIGDMINMWHNRSNVLYQLDGEDIVLTFTLSNAKMYGFAFGEAGEMCNPFGYTQVTTPSGVVMWAQNPRNCHVMSIDDVYPVQ